LQQAISKCLNSIPHGKQADGEPFGPFARLGLTASADAMLRLGEDLLPAGRIEVAPASLPSIERMHQLRIAVKRFRYSIELFHGAFPAPMRDTVYPQIELIQQQLGTLNDHATMQQQYQWLMAMPLSGDRVVDLAARIVQQYESVQDARRAFLDWWTPQQIGALRAELAPLLSNQAACHTTSR
jgi:CHAD domain-containing protein